MAKIVKREREHKKSDKKSSLHTKREKNGFKIKNLTVNLIRLSAKEIEKMTSEVQIFPGYTHNTNKNKRRRIECERCFYQKQRNRSISVQYRTQSQS